MDDFERYCEKLPKWLRWIVLFPVSVLFYVLANFLLNIGGKLLEFFSRDSPWSDKIFTHLISPGVAGFYAVGVAIAMAPGAKSTTALLITGVWLMIYGGAAFFAAMVGDWGAVIPSVVSAGAAIMGYSDFKSKQPRESSIYSSNLVE